MATQENIAVSNPTFAAESASFNEVVAKERKKQQEELAHLGAILRLVEEEIVEAKSGVAATSAEKGDKIVKLNGPTANDPNEGPSNTAFEDAMASMALALQLLQVEIAKFANNKAHYDSEISHAQVTAAQNNLNELQKKLAQIAKKEEEQKRVSFWEKFAEVVVGAVTIAVAAILLQPELAVMGILSLAAAAGAFTLATKLVADALEQIGASKETAEIVAAIVVCIAVTAASFMSGDPEQAAEEVTEATTETVADATGMVPLDIAEDAEEQTSTLQNVGRMAKNGLSKVGKAAARLNKFLGSRGRLTIMGLMTSLQNTQLTSKIADAIMEGMHYSKERREKIEQNIEYTVAAIAAVLTIATMTGATNSARSAAQLSVRATRVLTAVQKAGFLLGTVGEAGGNIASGTISIQQGKLEKALGEIKGALELLGTAMQMNSVQVSDDQRHQADVEKSQSVGNRSLMQLMKGEEAFARLFTAYSPV